MKSLCILAIAGLLLCCSGETPSWNSGGPVTPPDDILAVLRESRQVTLYRVTGEFSDDYDRYKANPKVAGHPKIEEKPLPAETAREVAKILGTADNYLLENDAWTCLPQPFYLVRAEGGRDTADVIVHECGDIEMTATVGGRKREWQHGLRPSDGEKRLWVLLRQVIPAPPNCCPS